MDARSAAWYRDWVNRSSAEDLDLMREALQVPGPSALTEEEKKEYRQQYLDGTQCTHCGGFHLRACRRVRKIVMRNREEIAEVEFWRDGQWNEKDIIWPEDIFDEENPVAGITEALDKQLQEPADG